MVKKKNEKNQKKMRRKLLLLLIFALALVAILLFSRGLGENPGLRTYDIYLTVGNHTGFNVATDALYFGTLMPGTSAKRFLTITNDFNSTMSVSIAFEGNVAAFLSSNNSVIISAYDNSTLEVSAIIPVGTVLGDYSGKIRMTSRLLG